MPVSPAAQRAAYPAARVILSCVLLLLFVDIVLAQTTGPFGIPRQPAAAPPDGITGWILAQQASFYRQLSGLVRATKADGTGGSLATRMGSATLILGREGA